MKNIEINDKEHEQLKSLCDMVRRLCEECEYEKCCQLIYKAMEEHPHAAQPHNLLGIVLEKTGDHLMAMRHFRAAWALDPSYRPANHNMNIYGTFITNGICAFDEDDLEEEKYSKVNIVYDKRGIGHVMSRNKIEYDEYGIGHITRRDD